MLLSHGDTGEGLLSALRVLRLLINPSVYLPRHAWQRSGCNLTIVDAASPGLTGAQVAPGCML